MFPSLFRDPFHMMPLVCVSSTGYWRSSWTNLKAACSSSSLASSPPASSLWRDKLSLPLHLTSQHWQLYLCASANELQLYLSTYYFVCSLLFFSQASLSIFASPEGYRSSNLKDVRCVDFIVTVQDSPCCVGYAKFIGPLMGGGGVVLKAAAKPTNLLMLFITRFILIASSGFLPFFTVSTES